MALVADLEPKVKVIRKAQQSTNEETVGLTFDELMRLLVEVDALNVFELTEKERVSVLST